MCRSCGPLFGENLLTLRKTINNEDAMSLEKQINDEIKAAMLAKEKVRLTALRAVKSEILLAKTADGSETIADGAVLKIVQKLVKQRRESIPKAVVPNWPRTNWPKPPNSKVSCLLR